MNRRCHWLLVCWLLPVLHHPLQGQTSFPMITHAHPVAVQRGQAVVVEVGGQQNFAGAYKVIVSGEGVQAEVLPPEVKPNTPPPARLASVKLRLTVAADALPGVREFRIATSLGVSSAGQILITQEPVMLDATNPRENKPMSVTLPCVVCGKLAIPEQVTNFAFEAEAGEMLTCEVYAARLQDKIHDLQNHADPALTLFDEQGKELAGNDDYCFADPKLSYLIKHKGKYRLQIRDAKFEGDARWVYALRITQHPDASHVFPLAHSSGMEQTVELIGTGVALQKKAPLRIPDATPRGEFLAPLTWDGQPLMPVPIWVSDLPVRTPAEAEWPSGIQLEIPCCINGRLTQPRQAHAMRFEAKAGQIIRFEVIARRFGTSFYSGLDGAIEIQDEQGRVLVRVDDQTPGIKDPLLLFNPPRNGNYTLKLSDLHGKAGDHFIYALEATYPQPDFTLRCDSDIAMIGPGCRVPWYVQITRLHGFNGPVDVSVEGLPEGVEASSCTIPANMTQGLIVLSAAKDAKPDAHRVRVVGKAKVGQGEALQEIAREARPLSEIYLPGGGRGLFEVDLHVVGVTETSDLLEVSVSPETITLKPGEEIKLNVKLARHARAKDANITLDVKLRHLGRVYADPLPPGLLMIDGQSKTLLGKSDEGYIILRAAPNAAPIKDVSICVAAHVSINFVVKVAHASPPLQVTIEGK